MLMGVPKILSPELLKILCEMGHGDTIVIADGNFPAASMAQRLVRLDGHDVLPILDAILKLFPLDTYVPAPVSLMNTVSGETFVPTIWDDYKGLISEYYPEGMNVQMIERFDFYEEAKNAYCIISTSESALYANIILKKGVVKS